jgi:DNA-binding transcriptional regulator YdaS (Cro superfamily)
MTLTDYLAEARGRTTELARAVGMHQAYLSQIATGKRPVNPASVAAFVEATGGRVRHWDLRPNDWHLIWPDLVGSDGAPAPAEKAAA